MIDIRKYTKKPFAKDLKSKSRQQEIIEFYNQIFHSCHFTDKMENIPPDAILVHSEYVESVKVELFFWVPK